MPYMLIQRTPGGLHLITAESCESCVRFTLLDLPDQLCGMLVSGRFTG